MTPMAARLKGFRLHSLRRRIAVFFVGLLVLVQLVVWTVLQQANESIARVLDDVRLGNSLNFGANREAVAELVTTVQQNPKTAQWMTLLQNTDEAIAAKLTPMLSVMSLSDAAKAAADDLGVPKARAYDIGVALKRRSDG